MLEETAQRAAELVAPQRMITVIGQGHGRFLGARGLPGRVLEQPVARDTGPGVFLAITYIFAQDPDALAVILPSDHFVQDRSQFTQHANSTFEMAERHPGKLILLGAVPDAAEVDYGWIEPGPESPGQSAHSTHNFRGVLSFHEKPSPRVAMEFFASLFLWNTMIIVARAAKVLWTHGRRFMPKIMHCFEQLRRVLRALPQEENGVGNREKLAVLTVYRNLKSQNFSRELLEMAPEAILVSPMTDVGWSDWGRPVRIVESLVRVGILPNFHLSCIASDQADA